MMQLFDIKTMASYPYEERDKNELARVTGEAERRP